jgi:hypothetical protein
MQFDDWKELKARFQEKDGLLSYGVVLLLILSLISIYAFTYLWLPR